MTTYINEGITPSIFVILVGKAEHVFLLLLLSYHLPHCCFRKAQQLAKQLGDLALEAQACYSLGNTFTLLRDYQQAIEYHMRHLSIAQELQDKLGQVSYYCFTTNVHRTNNGCCIPVGSSLKILESTLYGVEYGF